MPSPLQAELLSSILWRVPGQPAGVCWCHRWVCGGGRWSWRSDDPGPPSVQPGQLTGAGLHMELGAPSSIQPGWGGCRLVEGCLAGWVRRDGHRLTELRHRKMWWKLPNVTADITLCKPYLWTLMCVCVLCFNDKLYVWLVIGAVGVMDAFCGCFTLFNVTALRCWLNSE